MFPGWVAYLNGAADKPKEDNPDVETSHRQADNLPRKLAVGGKKLPVRGQIMIQKFAIAVIIKCHMSRVTQLISGQAETRVWAPHTSS